MQGQGFLGHWDVLEAPGHHPHVGRAVWEDTGVQEGSPRGEPGKGHTGKGHLGMATQAKAATAASALFEQLKAILSTKNATWKTTNEESQAIPRWGN